MALFNLQFLKKHNEVSNMPIHNHSNDQLMTMLHNIMNHNNRAEADVKKIQLYSVWELRNQAFCSGKNIKTITADGVLSAFRYKVGDGGIANAAKRQLILDHILEAPIPPTVDMEYTMKWGEPKSTERKNQLIRTLKGLISGVNKRNYSRDKFLRAKAHWEEDLTYLEEQSYCYH